MQYILARLREPSSYAGLGIILTALNLPADPSIVEAATHLTMGLAGFAAFFLRDRL